MFSLASLRQNIYVITWNSQKDHSPFWRPLFELSRMPRIYILVSFNWLKHKGVVIHNQFTIKYKWEVHNSVHYRLKYQLTPPKQPQSKFLRIVSSIGQWWKSETYKEIQSHQALTISGPKWRKYRKEIRLTWHSSAPERTSLYLALSSVQTTFSSLREQTWRWTWQWQHWAINHHTLKRMEQRNDGHALPNVISWRRGWIKVKWKNCANS